MDERFIAFFYKKTGNRSPAAITRFFVCQAWYKSYG